MNKKIILILIFYINLFSFIFAGIEDVGTTSSNFLKIPPFARAASMGEAFVSISDGISGLYYNPAGLSSSFAWELSMTHISWFQKMNYEFFSLLMPEMFFNTGKIGVGLILFLPGEITQTENLPSYDPSYLETVNFNDFINGKFYPYDYAVILGYSTKINKNFFTGINLKLSSQNIQNFSGKSFNIDLGIIYKRDDIIKNNSLRFGFALSNIGTDMKLDKEKFSSPKTFRLGISDKTTLFNNDFLISFQWLYQTDYYQLFSVGLEYWLYNIIALRCGYKMGAFNQFTFGGGVKYNNINFDYSFVKYEELGDTHRFTLSYIWGSPNVFLKKSLKVFSPNNDGYLDFINFYPEFETIEKLKSFKINIYDTNNIKLGEIKKQSADILWDGKINKQILTDGIYSAELSAKYETGESHSKKINFEIDNTPPDVNIEGEPKLLKPGQKEALLIPVTFNLYANDKNGIKKWALYILDSNKKLFFKIDGNNDPPPLLIWDGKGINGDYVDTGEVYYYYFTAMDNVGNISKTKLKDVIILLKEIKLTFSADAIFDIGEADVKISAYKILKKMKKVINKYPESKIIVAGHTDNIPPSGKKYKTNKELSKARAEAVKFFMVNLLGIDKNRIQTIGYGSTKPVASNDTEEGRKKNRRVEIIIKSTIYK